MSSAPVSAGVSDCFALAAAAVASGEAAAGLRCSAGYPLVSVPFARNTSLGFLGPLVYSLGSDVAVPLWRPVSLAVLSLVVAELSRFGRTVENVPAAVRAWLESPAGAAVGFVLAEAAGAAGAGPVSCYVATVLASVCVPAGAYARWVLSVNDVVPGASAVPPSRLLAEVYQASVVAGVPLV